MTEVILVKNASLDWCGCENHCVALSSPPCCSVPPAGFIAPCLPTKAHTRRQPMASRVRLYSRPGNDLTHRFLLIVDALARLRSRSCIIDGEALACDGNGIASFDLIRNHRANDSVFLYAFDLIELNGDDLRRDPLEVRKAASILAKARPGIRLNEHIEGNGEIVFRHACKLGLEGIVSKRKDFPTAPAASPIGSK